MAYQVVVQHRRRLVRDSLVLLLRDKPDWLVTAAVTTGPELVEACSSLRPHVVVLEADAADWDPCLVAATICQTGECIRFLGLYRTLSDDDLGRLRRSGMGTLVDQAAGVPAVMAALGSAIEGQAPVITARASREPVKGVLTPRERAVLSCVAGGSTSRVAANRLGISAKTVENHKQRIFSKLGVQNQAHAVAIAMRQGLLGAHDISIERSPSRLENTAQPM